MPHLSPLAWAFAPIIFWSLILCLMSFFWWQQSSYFPTISNKSKPQASNNWNWSCFKSFVEAPYF